jgi:regulator of replication initiation timing
MLDLDAIKKRHLDPEEHSGQTFYEGHMAVDLAALVAEVEKLREMDAERASELRYLEAENTRLRDILDRRFAGGAP